MKTKKQKLAKYLKEVQELSFIEKKKTDGGYWDYHKDKDGNTIRVWI